MVQDSGGGVNVFISANYKSKKSPKTLTTAVHCYTYVETSVVMYDSLDKPDATTHHIGADLLLPVRPPKA